MKPYSMDLRVRVAAAVDRHEGTQRELADRFQIGVSTLTRWLRRRRQTGAGAAWSESGRRTRERREIQR